MEKRSQSFTYSKSPAVRTSRAAWEESRGGTEAGGKRRKKMVKEVGSGGVAPEEDERSTKKLEIARPAARLVDLTN